MATRSPQGGAPIRKKYTVPLVLAVAGWRPSG
jgi:hypothetical protein